MVFRKKTKKVEVEDLGGVSPKKESEKAVKEVAAKKKKEADEKKAMLDGRKESLEDLSNFLFSLYRESETPSVRQKIQDWRRLLAELCRE